MGKISDFLSMSRSERIGAYAVVVLVAVIMAGMLLCKGCANRPVEVPEDVKSRMEKAEQLEQSIKEAKMDTLKTLRHKRKSSGSVKQKKQYKDRAVEDVPQY